VYEIVTQDGSRVSDQCTELSALQTCDIKDPQNITWVPPQGGGGPNYSGM
jgi:electron-transferring-flavoprotein dehydrogenase